MNAKKDRPLVDERSMELAEHFLQDETHDEDDKWNLAAAIQEAVEGWFFMREHQAEMMAAGADEGDVW